MKIDADTKQEDKEQKTFISFNESNMISTMTEPNQDAFDPFLDENW